MSKIDKRFSKLTRALFDAQLSTGGGFEKYCIVFISDKKQIWHDNIFYGVSDEQAQLIVMYLSELPNELTTPSKHGGLAAGTSVATLKTKTLSQIFDDILFEELQPTVKNPSCSISPKGSWANNGIYEVGAAAPTSLDNFNISFNRGACTVVGQPTKYRAGAETGREVKLGSAELAEGAKITLGTMTYNLTVNYGEGDILLTSKGNKASVSPNPLTAGSVKSSCNIYGTYPYFCNGASASTSAGDTNFPAAPAPDTKLPLLRWTDTLIGAKFANEASTGTRLEFYFPSEKNVTKVEFYNTVSGKWEVFAASNYSVSEAGNKQIQSVNVAYKKLTTTGSMSGALQLRFTVTNAARSMSEPATYNGEEITDEVFRSLAMNSSTIPFIAPMNDFPVTLAATGNRPAGVAAFAVNFEPGGQSPLDARSLVPTKADLIAAATYSAKNYYNGMLVVVADDGGKPALYILKDTTKITQADYSGWQRVDVGGQSVIEIVNDLTTGGTDKALSAEQGKALKGLIDAINNKIGQPSGIASLGADGKVPSAQLPSYVDDVIEFTKVYENKAAIPTSGLTTGSLHYAIAEKLMFKATNETTLDAGTKPESGKIYIAVADGNKLYRWGGDDAGLVIITSGNIAIGEAEGTAYDGLKGKTTTDKVNAHVANMENPHQVTKEQVGLGNVDNTSDLEKPISNATKAELDKKVNAVEGSSLVSDELITKLQGLDDKTTIDAAIADAKKAGTDAKTALDVISGQATGVYVANINAHYINTAASLNDADLKLDTKLYELDTDYTAFKAEFDWYVIEE